MHSQDMPVILPAKRKRNVVSYAELADDIDFEDCSLENDGASDIFEEDDEYGSRRKSKRLKMRSKKGSAAKRNNQPTKPFRFLDLPAELREEIYELALVEPDVTSIVSRMKAFRRTVARGIIDQHPQNHYSPQGENNTEADKSHVRLTPNLLAVNKQINFEASAHLYSQRFVFEDTRALHTFLITIGPSNRGLLSTVIVNGRGTGRGVLKGMNSVALGALASCINLKQLQFNCTIGYASSPQLVARQLYRDGHYFLEAFGCAKGKRDAAVKVIELEKWNDHYGTWPNYAQTSPDVAKSKQEFDAELRRLLG